MMWDVLDLPYPLFHVWYWLFGDLFPLLYGFRPGFYWVCWVVLDLVVGLRGGFGVEEALEVLEWGVIQLVGEAGRVALRGGATPGQAALLGVDISWAGSVVSPNLVYDEGFRGWSVTEWYGMVS